MRPFARWLFVLAATLCIFSTGAKPYWQSRLQVSVSVAPTFQGPGDVVASATAWGSCARAYNAAYANGTNPMCDLVAVTGGAAVGTLRVATTGFVDLTAYFSGSVTPAAACAAASGGSCKVTKIYDQTGNTNHWTQATLGSMPALTFSSSPTGTLPVVTCTSAANSFLATGNITVAQPIFMSAVYIRTGTVTTLTAILGSSVIVSLMGGSATANNAAINAGSNVNRAATDNSWHALQGLLNNTASAINVDGSDSGTVSAAGNAYSAIPLRFCRSNVTLDGSVAEAGIWGAAPDATARGNVNSNQHGVSGYNF